MAGAHAQQPALRFGQGEQRVGASFGGEGNRLPRLATVKAAEESFTRARQDGAAIPRRNVERGHKRRADLLGLPPGDTLILAHKETGPVAARQDRAIVQHQHTEQRAGIVYNGRGESSTFAVKDKERGPQPGNELVPRGRLGNGVDGAPIRPAVDARPGGAALRRNIVTHEKAGGRAGQELSTRVLGQYVERLTVDAVLTGNGPGGAAVLAQVEALGRVDTGQQQIG